MCLYHVCSYVVRSPQQFVFFTAHGQRNVPNFRVHTSVSSFYVYNLKRSTAFPLRTNSYSTVSSKLVFSFFLQGKRYCLSSSCNWYSKRNTWCVQQHTAAIFGQDITIASVADFLPSAKCVCCYTYVCVSSAWLSLYEKEGLYDAKRRTECKGWMWSLCLLSTGHQALYKCFSTFFVNTQIPSVK